MKRTFAFFLALVLLLGAVPLCGAAFTDQNFIGATFKTAVADMTERGIIGGFPDGSFSPRGTLTRAQAAKILCVMLEGAEKANALTKTDAGFSDVPATHWAAKFVAYCVDKGFVAGVGNGKYDPDGKLSSAAFAKMLLAASGTDVGKMTGSGWIQSVREAASGSFLSFNLNEVSALPVKRQEACQMAFNALFMAEAAAAKEAGEAKPMYTGVPERLKLLVVGNSFGNDCSLDYLFDLLKEAGVKDLTIGTLYYSGCSFEQHTTFGLTDQNVYIYYKNTTGSYQTNKSVTLASVLADEKWDVLILSTGLKLGVASTYHPWQETEILYLRQRCPDAILGYNMTWALQDKTESTVAFGTHYNRDQMKMYDMTVAATKSEVETEKRYSFILPTGTAIQNARTSFIGDNMTRDGGHLEKTYGCYTAALVWASKLTGVAPEKFTYVPESVTPGHAAVARESVRNALQNPYEITQSKYTTKP